MLPLGQRIIADAEAAPFSTDAQTTRADAERAPVASFGQYVDPADVGQVSDGRAALLTDRTPLRRRETGGAAFGCYVDPEGVGVYFADGLSDAQASMVAAYATWLRSNGSPAEVARLQVLEGAPGGPLALVAIAQAQRAEIAATIPTPDAILTPSGADPYVRSAEVGAVKQAAIREAVGFDATAALTLGAAVEAAVCGGSPASVAIIRGVPTVITTRKEAL